MPAADRSTETAIAPDILRGAVAGLVAGILASFVMDRFQALVSQAADSDQDAEPATAKVADSVTRAITGAPVAKPLQPLAGQIVHYALGTGLGIAYGIAAEFRPWVAAGNGTAFGLGTAALLDEVAVPAVGLGPAPWKTEASTHLYTLASHLVFGMVAELTRDQVRATLLPKG